MLIHNEVAAILVMWAQLNARGWQLEISAVQCSLSHPTGVAQGNTASPQLLLRGDLVLELQPVKMLSSSETFEKGLLFFVSEGDFHFYPFLFSYLWAAAL